MKKANISIVLPAYNTRPEFLRQAIVSVLAQTYLDWELIVVDDSTIAPVGEVVGEFQDLRIRYIRNPHNIGMAAARNRGIQEAHGEFIAFLDHDDVWLPEKLKLQWQCLNDDTQCGLVYSPIIFFGDVDEYIQRIDRRNSFNDMLWHNNILTCSCVMIRRDILARHHLAFSASAAPSDDYDLWLRIAIYAEIKLIDTPLVRYRIHAGNTSGNLLNCHLALDGIYQSMIPLIKHSRQSAYQKIKNYFACRCSRSWAQRMCAEEYRRRGMTPEFHRCLRRALLLNPASRANWRLMKEW